MGIITYNNWDEMWEDLIISFGKFCDRQIMIHTARWTLNSGKKKRYKKCLHS